MHRNDSGTHTRSQVYFEYFIIPNTSKFIILSRLYQELCAHCNVVKNDGAMGYVLRG